MVKKINARKLDIKIGLNMAFSESMLNLEEAFWGFNTSRLFHNVKRYSNQYDGAGLLTSSSNSAFF